MKIILCFALLVAAVSAAVYDQAPVSPARPAVNYNAPPAGQNAQNRYVRAAGYVKPPVPAPHPPVHVTPNVPPSAPPHNVGYGHAPVPAPHPVAPHVPVRAPPSPGYGNAGHGDNYHG